MNVENIQALAVHLRRDGIQDHFNLTQWYSDEAKGTVGDAINHCGTVACIAGHAMVLAQPELDAEGAFEYAESIGQDYLGLTDEQANDLFVRSVTRYSSITAAKAAQVLDHLAETGVVDWSIVT